MEMPTPGQKLMQAVFGVALLSEPRNLEGVLSTLTVRERGVIVLRFGLEDGHRRTLEEVGREFGVGRERIRQIEAKALRKLRHPSRSDRLQGRVAEDETGSAFRASSEGAKGEP